MPLSHSMASFENSPLAQTEDDYWEEASNNVRMPFTPKRDARLQAADKIRQPLINGGNDEGMMRRTGSLRGSGRGRRSDGGRGSPSPSPRPVRSQSDASLPHAAYNSQKSVVPASVPSSPAHTPAESDSVYHNIRRKLSSNLEHYLGLPVLFRLSQRRARSASRERSRTNSSETSHPDNNDFEVCSSKILLTTINIKTPSYLHHVH